MQDFKPQVPGTNDVLSALIGEPPSEMPAFVRDKPRIVGRDDFNGRPFDDELPI
jgi:hypothetical protein